MGIPLEPGLVLRAWQVKPVSPSARRFGHQARGICSRRSWDDMGLQAARCVFLGPVSNQKSDPRRNVESEFITLACTTQLLDYGLLLFVLVFCLLVYSSPA